MTELLITIVSHPEAIFCIMAGMFAGGFIGLRVVFRRSWK